MNSIKTTTEMAKRKILTAEEKREKLLELFYETGDVFQLKDLERLAPKEKGIVQQSVKVTLQELVDNGQVRTDKIAGSIFFWSFPSEALNSSKALLSDVQNELQQLQNKIDNAQQTLSATVTAEDAEDIASIEHEINILKNEEKELVQKLAKHAVEIDYEEVINKQRSTKQILEAANRWTDNIYSIKTWCKRKFDKQDRELNKAFGIPEDMDYVELK